MKEHPDVEAELMALIGERAEGVSRAKIAHDDVLQGALDLVRHQQHCLEAAAQRFEDIATVIRGDGRYDNAGFFDASARRCRTLTF